MVVEGGRREDGSAFRLIDVLGWDEETRRAAFTGSAMKRAKLPMMLRNALIAAGNSLRADHDPRLLEAVRALAGEEMPDMVRETARSVLDRLGRGLRIRDRRGRSWPGPGPCRPPCRW